MRRLLAAAAIVSLVLVPVGPAFAQTSSAGTRANAAALHAASAGLEKKILSLETQRIAAMVKKDLAALAAVLGDDLTYTHSGGTTDTKASFLALIKDRGRYLGVDYSDTQVVQLNAGTVIVRGRALIRLEDTPSYTVLFLDVWALRDGSWKMVAWQATRVPE